MKRYKSLKEKAPKIVKDVLTGIHKYAKTFGIMTAENPMGVKISSSQNKERNKEFFEHLKRGRYQYVKIKGKYGNIENPVLIINIPLKELLFLGNEYKQESVIYGEIPEYQKIHFEYWERDNENSSLRKKDETNYFHTIQKAKDFYSSIKGWKFTIPFPIFQESIEKWYTKIEGLDENDKEQIKEYITELVENNEKYTGHYYFRLRGRINSILRTKL